MDLSRLPREELEGLDRGAVESDRKKYWEKFFEKYEQMGTDEKLGDVGLDEIDDPELVADRCRGQKRGNLELPVSKTFRKWVKDHGEEFDELATIAGPPAIDEEQLTDEDSDSDEDDLADLIDDNENIPPTSEQSDTHSPPSSPLPRLVDPSDSESDLLLYSSTLPTTNQNIFAPLSISHNINYKDKFLFSPKLSSSRNNSFAASPTAAPAKLICSTCSKQSEYSTLLGLDQSVFQCDTCMLSDTHPGCGEMCDKCREIAASLDARWIHKSMVEREADRSGDVSDGREEAEDSSGLTDRQEDAADRSGDVSDRVEGEKVIDNIS